MQSHLRIPNFARKESNLGFFLPHIPKIKINIHFFPSSFAPYCAPMRSLSFCRRLHNKEEEEKEKIG